jgi:hypothetical protein
MGAVSIDQHEPGFSYSSLVYEIRESGLTTAEIAAVTGVQERQVQHPVTKPETASWMCTTSSVSSPRSTELKAFKFGFTPGTESWKGHVPSTSS